MATTETHDEKSKISTADNQKGIDHHKTAAKHHEEAAKHHTDAAKFHEVGEHQKAASSTVKAQGHSNLASESLSNATKHHALNH